MKKLLNKPFKAFAIYSFIVLVCSIPAYYFIVDYIWLSELDEHNQIFSEKIKRNIQSIPPGDSLDRAIALWNKLQPGTAIQPVDQIRPDSIYNIYRKEEYITSNEREVDRFQGLISYFTIGSKPYKLTIETNVEETHETIGAITVVTFLFFFLLLGGFIILNKEISQKLWRPFYDTLNKIKQYDLHSQQPFAFSKTDIIEFTQLNEHIEKLTERNLKAYSEQKEFTENASHELQTPLAIVQSKLDLLLQNSSLTKEQSSIIDEGYRALSRVSRINKNLVLLARIENQQYRDTEPTPISQVLTDILEMLEEHIAGKQIRLESNIQPGIIKQANRILVEILITNLSLNAIRHNFEGGTVRITLSDSGLQLANTGQTALNEQQLFKRFSSVSTQTPGSGLGLAIVKQICLRYSWDIAYYFGDGYHFFDVKF